MSKKDLLTPKKPDLIFWLLEIEKHQDLFRNGVEHYDIPSNLSLPLYRVIWRGMAQLGCDAMPGSKLPPSDKE